MTRPLIVTLCGSTRFKTAFEDAAKRLTAEGRMVFTVGWFGHAEPEGIPDGVKRNVDALHLCKIEASDYILVLNVDGYIGESTAREIAYATLIGKPVAYLEPIDAA